MNEFNHASDPVPPALGRSESRPARRREAALLTDEQRASFLERWTSVQVGFVTDPPGTVRSAEHLLDEVAGAVLDQVSSIRDEAVKGGVDASRDRPDDGTDAEAGTGESEDTANRGPDTPDTPDPDTEELRLALIRYRTAFSKLVGV